MAEVAHSYADPATGCVHLTLRGEGGVFRELVEAARSDPHDLSFKAALVSYSWSAHRTLVLHEWAHVLQLATYPALFLRSARAARAMIGPAAYLATNPGPHPLPLGFVMDERWRMSDLLATAGIRPVVGRTGMELQVVEDRVGRGILTERDLLEEDATVFQYRAEIAARGSGRAYRNWLRESPRYSRVFVFLARHFGDEAALRLLPILARVAFRTTRPLEGFFTSFGTLMHEGKGFYADPDIGDGELEEILLENLRTPLGSIEPGQLTMQTPEFDDPKGVIDEPALADLVRRYRQLPIALLTEIDLHGSDDQRGVARAALRSPEDLLDRLNWEEDTRPPDFLPPITTIALADPDFPRGASLMAISPLHAAAEFPGVAGQTYAQWTSTMLKGRMMWRAIRETPEGPTTNCPHEACAYHRTGLCRGWMTIPAAADDCEFPEFLVHTTKHGLSADGMALEPVTYTRED